MQFESKESMVAYFRENPSLSDLRIDNSPDLTSLPILPSGLIDLRVINCQGLTSLPELPVTLTYLAVCNCPELTDRGLKVGTLTIQIG